MTRLIVSLISTGFNSFGKFGVAVRITIFFRAGQIESYIDETFLDDPKTVFFEFSPTLFSYDFLTNFVKLDQIVDNNFYLLFRTQFFIPFLDQYFLYFLTIQNIVLATNIHNFVNYFKVEKFLS